MLVLTFIFFMLTSLTIFCSTDIEYNNFDENFNDFDDFENFRDEAEEDEQESGEQQEIRPKKVVGDLIATFDDPNTKIAENALMNLRGIMQDRRIRLVAVKALIHNLSHQDPKMRMRCAQALKREDMPPRARKTLEKMVNTENHASVLVSIFDTLSLVGDEGTIDILKSKSDSTNNEVIKDFADSAVRVIEKRLEKGGGDDNEEGE
jgi:hypothetical protein